MAQIVNGMYVGGVGLICKIPMHCLVFLDLQLNLL